MTKNQGQKAKQKGSKKSNAVESKKGSKKVASSKPSSKGSNKLSSKPAEASKGKQPTKAVTAKVATQIGSKIDSLKKLVMGSVSQKKSETKKGEPKRSEKKGEKAKAEPKQTKASAGSAVSKKLVKEQEKPSQKNTSAVHGQKPKTQTPDLHHDASRSAKKQEEGKRTQSLAPSFGIGRISKQEGVEAVCREVACDGLATTGAYCRLHYIKNWKKVKRKEVILSEGKLIQFIEELVLKYPDKYIEAIRQDLVNDKDFAKVIYDLELDESADDFDGDVESDDGVIDNIRRDFDDEADSF